MFSSSSDESDFEECYLYCNECYQGTSFANNYSNPFYHTMGHPLINYTPVPSPNRKQRSKKNNTNCFVKAFRWYTQEHILPRGTECGLTDMPGFAHWLKYKYDEFVRSSQKSTLEASNKPVMRLHDTCATARTARIWKTRHSFEDKNEVPEKELRNVEYIMQPKNLVPASQCCQPTPTPYCDRSNITLTSINTKRKKTTVKSQSLWSLQPDNRKSFDLITVNKASIETQERNQLHNKSLKKVSKNRDSSKSNAIKDSSFKKSYLDTFYQCPEAQITKMGIGTQFDSTGMQAANFICERCAVSCSRLMRVSQKVPQVLNKHSSKSTSIANPAKQDVSEKMSNIICDCSQEKVLAVVKVADPKYQSKHRKLFCNSTEINLDVGSQTQHQTDCSICQQTEKIRGTVLYESSRSSARLKLQGSSTTKEPESCKRVCDGVQTSDHSIHLEKIMGQDYPLFMKIICADKLSEERNCSRCTP